MSEVAAIVCTRDRPELLRAALDSLTRQSLARERYRVVVVDNGDGSGISVAEDAGADTVLHVLEPGLSRARNAGWQASDAEVFAFLDDDAVAPPEWLETGLHLLREHDAAAAGGPIVPVYDESPPHWFRDEYELRTWGDVERFLERGESFSASNLFLTRATLSASGGFDARLGMRGQTLAVGEETALFRALWDRGDLRAVYSPGLVVRHRVPAAKVSVAYQLRRSAAAGDAWALGGRPRRRDVGRAARDACAVALLAARALARARRPWQQWAVEELGAVAGRYGSLRRALRRAG
jgi:glycosyltransferase involved in cell wall biosynthesis